MQALPQRNIVDLNFFSVVDPQTVFGTTGTPAHREQVIQTVAYGLFDLPDSVFVGPTTRSIDQVRKVINTMQVTVQHLLSCLQHVDDNTRSLQRDLKESEEERAGLFEEVIELREALQYVKREARTDRSRSGKPAATHSCSICGNQYPSAQVLASHMRKRHGKNISAQYTDPQGHAETVREAAQMATVRNEVSTLKQSIDQLLINTKVQHELDRERSGHNSSTVQSLEAIALIKAQQTRMDSLERLLVETTMSPLLSHLRREDIERTSRSVMSGPFHPQHESASPVPTRLDMRSKVTPESLQRSESFPTAPSQTSVSHSTQQPPDHTVPSVTTISVDPSRVSHSPATPMQPRSVDTSQQHQPSQEQHTPPPPLLHLDIKTPPALSGSVKRAPERNIRGKAAESTPANRVKSIPNPPPLHDSPPKQNDAAASSPTSDDDFKTPLKATNSSKQHSVVNKSHAHEDATKQPSRETAGADVKPVGDKSTENNTSTLDLDISASPIQALGTHYKSTTALTGIHSSTADSINTPDRPTITGLSGLRHSGNSMKKLQYNTPKLDSSKIASKTDDDSSDGFTPRGVREAKLQQKQRTEQLEKERALLAKANAETKRKLEEKEQSQTAPVAEPSSNPVAASHQAATTSAPSQQKSVMIPDSGSDSDALAGGGPPPERASTPPPDAVVHRIPPAPVNPSVVKVHTKLAEVPITNVKSSGTDSTYSASDSGSSDSDNSDSDSSSSDDSDDSDDSSDSSDSSSSTSSAATNTASHGPPQRKSTAPSGSMKKQPPLNQMFAPTQTP